MGTMDTRRIVRFADRVYNGWHWRDVYHHRRKLDLGRAWLWLRHHFAATRYTYVSNRSHNGS